MMVSFFHPPSSKTMAGQEGWKDGTVNGKRARKKTTLETKENK